MPEQRRRVTAPQQPAHGACSALSAGSHSTALPQRAAGGEGVFTAGQTRSGSAVPRAAVALGTNIPRWKRVPCLSVPLVSGRKRCEERQVSVALRSVEVASEQQGWWGAGAQHRQEIWGG